MKLPRWPPRRTLLTAAALLALGGIEGCAFALRRGYRQLDTFETGRITAAADALANFERLLRTANDAQAAGLFLTDGQFQVGQETPQTGPDAIRPRLARAGLGHGGFHVASAQIQAGEVMQKGQRTGVDGAAGNRRFEAAWVLAPDGRWRLQRLWLAATPP